jgi:hypothetical protein
MKKQWGRWSESMNPCKLMGMESSELKRIESWLALIAEELYVARLDRESDTKDEDTKELKSGSEQRRNAHVEQILKLRIALNE